MAPRSSPVLPHTANSWTAAGPSLLNTNGTDPETWATGRVASIGASSVNNGTYTLYAGSAGGGVWKSTDNGLNWTPEGQTTFQSLSIGAVAVDPGNAANVLAGTGEAFDPIGLGYGIYKSTDGGSTWTRKDVSGNTSLNGHAIAAIVYDPTNTNDVYAAVADQRTFSTLGVIRSTDGGSTWSPAGLSGDNVSDLVIDGNGNMYAAVISGGQDAAGVYYSAEASHGAVWTPVSGGGTLPSDGVYYRLALDPNTRSNLPASQIVYAAVGGNPALEGVYRSSNGGTVSWVQIGQNYPGSAGPCPYSSNAAPGVIPNFSGSGGDCVADGQAYYDLVLAADGNSLYFGQINIFKADDAATNNSPQWYNLSNGYQTLCNTLNPPPDYHTNRACGVVTHVDQHAMLVVPTTPATTVYFGNDGGLYKTPDGGQTLVNANGATNAGAANPQGDGPSTNPMSTMQFYGAAVHGSDILAGSQDNGSSLTTNGGANWNEACCGDGMYDAISPDGQTMYTEGPGAAIVYSTNGGQTFQDAQPPSDGANFVAPLVMDPKNVRVYSGQTHLWESAAGSTTWTNIGPSASTQALSAVAVAPSNSNVIYVADPTGDVYVTQDATSATPTWSADQSILGNPNVNGLAVDPTNPNIVYAAVDSWQAAPGNHLYKGTLSAGTITWTDISTGLPNTPFYSVAVDPSSPQTIYAGGFNGVYVSKDGGSTWAIAGANLPHVQVTQIVVVPTVIPSPSPRTTTATVYAVTFGRGIWSTSAPVVTAARVARFTARRARGTVTFRWKLSIRGNVSGFDVFANRHRLNRTLIPVHQATTYRYAAHWNGAGPYRLRLVLTNGQSVIVPAR